MPHVGSCFCGNVQLEVTGTPEAMGYCHCRSCQSWSGGPVNAFSLWKPDAVQVTSGAEHIAKRVTPCLSTAAYFKLR
ncbi:MAG TPA: GFA family protein, partial [Caulobacteraceae bacterium]|nr:GFA family protein [Caulobacteraceae bacterium]